MWPEGSGEHRFVLRKGKTGAAFSPTVTGGTATLPTSRCDAVGSDGVGRFDTDSLTGNGEVLNGLRRRDYGPGMNADKTRDGKCACRNTGNPSNIMRVRRGR